MCGVGIMSNYCKVRYWGVFHRGVRYRGVNLLIDTSSGAAFKASCGRCGNREIATPMIATPIIPVLISTNHENKLSYIKRRLS